MGTRRLKAYTLLEMVVAMVLSAIVIGLCYAGLRIFRESRIRFEQRREAMEDISQIDRWLTKDFAQAMSIVKTSDRQLSIQTRGKNIYYTFTDEGVSRNNQPLADFPIHELEMKMMGESQHVSGLLINELSFVIQVEEEDHYPCRYLKKYGAKAMMYIENQE